MNNVTYEKNYNEAKNFSTKKEFREKSPQMYRIALKNKWLKTYTWLIEENVYKDKVDCVYCYLFAELNAVYVGRTLMKRIKIRDLQHRNSEYKGKRRPMDSVKRFAVSHNINLPKMTILEQNLTVNEGAKREGYWVNYYRKMGYYIINIAKTGSLGSLNKGKWTEENCYQEALKYKNRSDFSKGSCGAYDSARRHGWLKEYTWFTNRQDLIMKWNKDECYKEAKKYKSRFEFFKKNASAYDSARRHGWLKEYTWFTYYVKWTEENCYQEALKYKTKNEFKKSNPSAYNIACKNKWINNYTWFVNGMLKWDEESCYKEAKKYNSKSDFQKNNKSAYVSALKNGWINNYTWFIQKHKKWDEESCYKEAKKYKTKLEFCKNCQYPYKIAKINGWINEYTWLI